MKNEILELFKAYETETEWDGNAIPESMYNALADDIIRLYSNYKISRNGIVGHFGLSARVIAIDEARHILGNLPNLIFIAGEDIRKYPELPTNELDEISDKVKYGKLQLTITPETLDAFQRMNEQMILSAENIKSLSEDLKAYDRENNPKKKHKGHERPYKFHR